MLGIDGGATSTLAILAEASGLELGRGIGGPSNIQAVGEEQALRALEAAVAAAFETASLPRSRVEATVMGLAGIDLNEGVELIRRWADDTGLSHKLSVANDATLLFAAGTPEGWGLAIVAGTGSIAFTLDREGRDSRAGGWGYLMGDEGSAFRMGLLGLRAACRAADRIGPPTKLLPALLDRLGSTDARDFIPAVYRGAWDKAAIASLAPIVLELSAEGDEAACTIFESETYELARTAAGAVINGGLPREGVPVALTGGLVLRNESFRDRFLANMRTCGVVPGPVGLVEEPALGALVLARKLAGAG